MEKDDVRGITAGGGYQGILPLIWNEMGNVTCVYYKMIILATVLKKELLTLL